MPGISPAEQVLAQPSICPWVMWQGVAQAKLQEGALQSRTQSANVETNDLRIMD
jgi:hypothetical protein